MERILINNDPIKEQIRVAHINGNELYDLEIEYAGKEQKVGSICNAEVISTEPSLEAAFVKFGSGRNGFLSIKEIAPEYYPEELRDRRDVSIKDILFEGQKLLIQVNKEERGTKGAALSTYISLAGCYLVLMPNNPKAGGISRRIEGGGRDELREILNSLTIPEGMGVIIRTAGTGKSLEELQWDLDVLVNLWEAIKQASKNHGAPFLIHQESDIAIRAVRDHLRPDIEEIIIDDPVTFEKVQNYIEKVRPTLADRVKLYQEPHPLFSQFQIEKQIESAFQRKVKLAAGGEIVIDRSEALTAIDINSAQSTKGVDIEETAFHTNIEAAKEIAKQLRIRDLGGLFVIDFIDMERESNNHKVEECLRDAFKNDRARIQIARISRFGLLEMSRQRLRSALNEAYQIVCPRCHGQGSIRNVKSHALAILNIIEEKALKERPAQIQAQVPSEVATYLLNEQRTAIQKIESLYSANLFILPNPHIQTPEYHIRYIGSSAQRNEQSQGPASYELISQPKVSFEPETKKAALEKQEPIVKDIIPSTPAPRGKKRKKSPGILKKIFTFFFEKQPVKKTKSKTKSNGKYKSTRTRQYTRRTDSKNTQYSQKQGRKPATRTPSKSNYRKPRRSGSVTTKPSQEKKPQKLQAIEEKNPIPSEVVEQKKPQAPRAPMQSKPEKAINTTLKTEQQPVVAEKKPVIIKKFEFQEAEPDDMEMVETTKASQSTEQK